MFVSLEGFVCVFWCACKFCCKHEAETRMVWTFFAVSAADSSSHPPTTTVAVFIVRAQNSSLSCGH